MNSPDELDLTGCPQCAAPAEVVDRFDLPSTSGPVAHVTVLCMRRHRFTVTTTTLDVPAEEVAPWHRRAS